MTKYSHVHDRDLLDALESFGCEPFSGSAWRTTWATRDPLIGSSAGGRWHPQDSFEALYTSLDEDGALAEAYFHLSRAPVFTSSQMKLYRLRVKTLRTLILEDMEALKRLGIEEVTYRSMDYTLTQAIGAAAYLLELDGLIVPSSRSSSMNMVLFLDRLIPDESLIVEEDREVNWPAWKETRKRS